MMKRASLLLMACAVSLLIAAESSAREHAAKPAFKYVGGTIQLPERCAGNLEMSSNAMTFECSDASVRIPFAAIRFMQYRKDISRKVRRMKPHWRVNPQTTTPLFGAKNNRYFTIVYQEKDESPLDTLVFEVSPDAMRPYLAEIDLRAGQRVEVENLDDYD
jgi:hypothetical protein